MAFQSDIAGAQIDGARDYQEDAFLITHLTDANGKPSALVIVADGMGGHAAGNVASNMAVQAFNKSITTLYPTDALSESLNVSILKANAAIAETVKETPALDGMGCTFVGVIIEGRNVWWVSVGDSHLYLLRNRTLTKLNEDHSYGGFLDRMEAAGTPVDIEPGLSRNMLMSAITGADIAEIDCPTMPFTLENDDKLVICSDGLDTLSEGKIIQYSDWADSPKECADALMSAVEDAAMPRQDNTTAVVVKIIDDGISESAAASEPAAVSESAAAGESADVSESAATSESAPVTEPAAVVGDTVTHDLSPPDEKIASTAAEIEELSVTLEEEIVETPEETVDLTADDTPVDSDEIIDDVSDESEKSKTGLIIGIAASVLVALIIAAYLMFSGSKPDEAIDQSASEELTSDEVMPEETVGDEASSEETLTEVAEIAEESTDEKETMATAEETTPEPEPKVAPETESQPTVETSSASKKEFQDDLKNGGKAPVMIVVPTGTFDMGSPSSSRFVDERPRHKVKIESFAVSKFEVTYAEYDKFAKATDRKLPDDLYMDRETHPAVFVEWDDAYYYAKWLSEQTGKKYRLLSESEWEYAASTGTKSPFWWGFNEEPGRAHCFGCKTGLDPRKPSKIGGFEANKFGLHDTAGNVAEWVQDCWHENYKSAPVNNEVWEGGDCSYRAVRGGAYISPPQSIRSAKRDKLKSDSGYDHVGIRIARELD